MTVEVTFFGVRGVVPATGPSFNRFGGNTSCVLVTSSKETLILDLGTGAHSLMGRLMRGEFGKGLGKSAILLSHGHFDHIQGFGLFAPLFVKGNCFEVWGQADSQTKLEEILDGQLSPHFSPIYSLKNLDAKILCHPVSHGASFDYGSAHITAMANPHGACTALAFRIEVDGKTVVYAPDVGYPQDTPTADAIAFYRDADLLIHDATFSPADQKLYGARGQSSYQEALAAAVEAKAKRLALFHYDQDYVDVEVARLVQECTLKATLTAPDVAVIAAQEGETIQL